MGDYTFFHIEVKASLQHTYTTVDDEILTVQQGLGRLSLADLAGDYDYGIADDGITWNASGESRCGDHEEFANELLKLIEETHLEMAFVIIEDAKYEWMGSVYYHVPGRTDFEAACDSDSRVVARYEDVRDAVDIAELFGRLHVEAYEAFVPVGGQLALDDDAELRAKLIGPIIPADHEIRPDDLPEEGDRCKECGKPITWIGPSTVTDWEHTDGDV